LPYFTDAASGKDYTQNKPILIKELEKNNISKDTIILSSKKTVTDSSDQPELIKNINGQFTLSIPRNTWITSPDMNIELSGEIDVIKNYDSIELFGAINTVRGQFAIYGKEFSIVEGNINFSGGKELNPDLNIILEYIFRSADRTKKNLELSIKGTAQNPKLSFSLDGSNIDEGNAISYLLFGKSIDQLTQSQQSDVSNSEANFAKTLAGNFLAAQLSSTVGGALGLDVIEISGNEGWQQASLTAGKYLTDDLYVSYERGFGSSETNEVNPRIVTMEYQLTKFLYFQLVEGNDKTSGFDAVIKFTW
jgi:translocation and assembly module TamB